MGDLRDVYSFFVHTSHNFGQGLSTFLSCYGATAAISLGVAMDVNTLRSKIAALIKAFSPGELLGRLRLTTPVRQYGAIAAVAGFFLIIGVGVTGAMLSITSSTRFCLTCHEMNVHQQELALSPHAKDADGNAIGCSQCHLPRGVGPRYFAVKTYSGLKDVYVHFNEAPQNLDRRALQPVARRFVDDASCMKCHDDLYKDAKNKGPISALGKVAHDSYNGLDGKTYRNCVGCHVNIAHLPVFDRRLDVNKDFAKKIAAQGQNGGAQ